MHSPQATIGLCCSPNQTLTCTAIRLQEMVIALQCDHNSLTIQNAPCTSLTIGYQTGTSIPSNPNYFAP